MNNIMDFDAFGMLEYGAMYKTLREIKLTKTTNPEVTITITMDQNYRITFIRNPRGITFPFRMNNVLNKHQLENWMTANGFKSDETQSRKQLKGHELVKNLMIRGYSV